MPRKRKTKRSPPVSASPLSDATRLLLLDFCRLAKPREVRPIREWAEACVRLPEGPKRFSRYRCQTLPWTGHLMDAIDSGEFRAIVTTGNIQGGKTLNGFTLPLAWHLAEHGETVVGGVPSAKTGFDKVRTELEPIFANSPELRHLWPTKGKGSQGGDSYVLQFTNGAELRIMTGGGGDEERSSFTTRVAGVTEADRLDEQSENSTEAAKIYQIMQRCEAFGEQGRFYAECTVTDAAGYVWRQYQEGTASRILCPCVHCGEWVAPEREHFTGAEMADTLDEAIANGSFCCPACGECFDDRERREMNEQSLLVHRGQAIEAGRVVGDRVSTTTLGFRFSAFHNLLWSTAHIARKVFEAAHDRDAESANRAIRQWCWVEPMEPEDIELAPLEKEDVLGRAGGWHTSGAATLQKSMAPAEATVAVSAIDLRKTQIHYGFAAFDSAGRGHIADVGSLAVDHQRYGVLKGLRVALREFYEAKVLPGLPTASGDVLEIGWTPIDCRWRPQAPRAFMRELRRNGDERFLAGYGCGPSAGPGMPAWHAKKEESPKFPRVSEHYYLEDQVRHRVLALFADTNHYKTAVREGMTTPATEPGSLTVFDPVTEQEQRVLDEYGRHLVAEKPVFRMIKGRGLKLVWEQVGRRANHWFDVTYWLLVAAHLMGVRVIDAEPPMPPSPDQLMQPLMGRDGETFRLTRRAA